MASAGLPVLPRHAAAALDLAVSDLVKSGHATPHDVVVTDKWISMGQEEEAARRKKDFAGYQVNIFQIGFIMVSVRRKR